ncbi:hypothetical protein [Yoonia litorea]|uniref:Uncharacterized protein n=1 Tax=Yoonia litorea TaxID=1123755 RepID=A0A1I6MUV1_9RHOB|nr:hypothetical protein [Yoonia litorea]SFS19506.1 hypothetical protein SAMN05444714_2215 [Yoonia litorea]
MAKHILDRPTKQRDSDLAHAVLKAGKEYPHRETLALQRRTRLRQDGQKQAQFLRCAREEA